MSYFLLFFTNAAKFLISSISSSVYSSPSKWAARVVGSASSPSNISAETFNADAIFLIVSTLALRFPLSYREYVDFATPIFSERSF